MYVIPTEILLVVFIFKHMQLLKFINQSTCPSLDIQTLNCQCTLRVSTFPEEQNPPIWELLFLLFDSSLLNEYPLWYFLVLEEIILFRWGCPSFHFLIYNINLTSFPTLTLSNLFLFATDCFAPMWLVRIWIQVGDATCCLTCYGFLLHKTGFLYKG